MGFLVHKRMAWNQIEIDSKLILNIQMKLPKIGNYIYRKNANKSRGS